MSGIINSAESRSGVIDVPPSILLTFTRDSSTATGTQAITGAGFSPRTVLLIASKGAKEASIGFVDSSLVGKALTNDQNRTSDQWSVGAWHDRAIQIMDSASVSTTGHVLTYDIDGFTIQWTTYGSPSGSINCRALCIR
jgi:hypothetical protein